MPQTRPGISATRPVTVPLLPLTPPSFAPFGTCITAPLGSGQNEPPNVVPPPRYPGQQPRPVSANQNTALKSSPISPMINHYPSSNSPPSRPLMSMFSCFPRRLQPASSSSDQRPESIRLPITILERHPYTTQTFSPLALPATAEPPSTAFLVVVAPSLPTTTAAGGAVSEPPDLANVRAFLARGDQAVTYAPGTWHAPMIVLGASRVDFVVTQFVNGVPDDDCQEVDVDGVSVDLDPTLLRGLLPPVRAVL